MESGARSLDPAKRLVMGVFCELRFLFNKRFEVGDQSLVETTPVLLVDR